MICSFQGDCNWDSPFLKYPQLALLPMQPTNSTRAKKKDDKKREDNRRRKKKKKKQKKEEEGRGLSIVLHCIIM